MRNTFAKKLLEFAEQDSNIMLLTGDLGFSVFEKFIENFPHNYINCGVAEQNMIGMAAGLALKGKKVFVYSIIPFITYRVLEQIRNDLCYQRLPVKIFGVGTGLVYSSQGSTHHAIEDIGIMTSIPDLYVFSPGDPREVEKVMDATLNLSFPSYVRMNKGGDPVINTEETISNFKTGEPLRVYGKEENMAIFATGNMLPVGLEVIKELEKSGINGSLYSFHTMKPCNEKSVLNIIKNSRLIVTMEEQIRQKGIFPIIASIAVKKGIMKKFMEFSLPDAFIHDVGSQDYCRKKYGLDKDEIVIKIKEVL